MEASDALTLARQLWQRIELQRHSSGIDEPVDSPRGLHGYLDYYRGIHRLRFASPEFSEHHLGRYVGFTDNWCAPVIDSTVERMNPLGIRLGTETREADGEFQRVMDANDAKRGMGEAFTVMTAAGRSYGLVWGNPDDETTPRVTFEHPEFCTIAYDADTGLDTASAKAWLDNETGYLTLYTADEVWKWQWSVPPDNDPRRPIEWVPRQGAKDDTWPLRNPMGMQPMVEFRNTALLDNKPISDLAGVAAMQDAVNLVWAYLFNGLDFATLPQRVAMGTDVPKVPILDADGQIVGEKAADLKKLAHDRILWLTGENAKIGSWPSAALDVFSQVISLCVDHIAAQTRTPPHYLIGKMANMSADALTVAETGLVAKVFQRNANTVHPQRGIYQRIALAQGDPARAKAATTGAIVFADPQYRSLAQKIDAFQKFRAAGMPLEWLLEWYGLEPNDVDRVVAMAKAENDVLVAAQPIKAPAGAVLPRGDSQLTLPTGTEPAAPTVPPDPGNPGQ